VGCPICHGHHNSGLAIFCSTGEDILIVERDSPAKLWEMLNAPATPSIKQDTIVLSACGLQLMTSMITTREAVPSAFRVV